MKNISFRNDVLPLKNKLFRLSLRITLNKEEAEDIVQDTLIKIWDKRFEWDSIDSIENFSFKICRNLSLDRIKRKDNKNKSLNELSEGLNSSYTPQDAIILRDKLNVVRDIINSLPEKQRTCLQLRDFEGKKYREIAKVLDITEEQVKINIFRARNTIKVKYQDIEQYGL